MSYIFQNMEKCFLLIYLLLISTSESLTDFGFNNPIELIDDMSNTCIDELHSNIFLTFGMGVSDAAVIIISDNDLYPNCELTFYTSGGYNSVYVLVVIEFPDHTEGPNNACQDSNSDIYIKEPSFKQVIDVCSEVNKLKFGYFATPVYSIISSATNVTVKVETKSLFETVKITATSARKLNQYDACDDIKEVPCLVANFSVCISIELLCDENINCGQAANNDEDVRICDEGRYRRLWLVVLFGTIMIIIVVFFSVHLLKTCLPSIPDSFFIFNEDEDNKLILSTVFSPAPDTLRQPMLIPNVQQQSSSFRFKTVPVTNVPPSEGAAVVTVRKEEKRRMTFIDTSRKGSLKSDEYEIELESHLYKEHETKNVDHPDEQITTPKASHSDEAGEVKSIYTARPLSSKRPRFQRDVVSIMNYADQPASIETGDEEDISQPQREKPKKSTRRDSMELHSSKRNKHDQLPVEKRKHRY